MSYFIYKETCFTAPVECYERGGNTTYEQASNSKQKPATKYAVQEIHPSTSNPTIKDTISEIMMIGPQRLTIRFPFLKLQILLSILPFQILQVPKLPILCPFL